MAFLFCLTASAAYDQKDVKRVESMLAAAKKLPKGTNLMVYFGKQFIGVPYVAHTLDNNKEEQLVVNTRELDCTTFVENVLALTLCASEGKTRFEDFLVKLKQIRYRGGQLAYANRLHYFTDWIEDNQKMGFVKKVESKSKPFTAVQHLNVNFMSEHYKSYTMLAAHPEWVPEIKKAEQALTGRSYRYIPKASIANTKLFRNTIYSGDIIAILTNKTGLDTSHIGIAYWEKDGLHLMNASQVRGKVVIETMLFRTYMKKHSSQIGIRVCRVVNSKKN